jgi:hypothetical protein
MSVLLTDAAQVGQIRTLPQGVVFATASPTKQGVRFTNLGAACTPTASVADCPALDSGANWFTVSGTDLKITLYQAQTGLYKSIFVAPGGRVNLDPAYTP